jgi:YD repeat-containing protein
MDESASNPLRTTFGYDARKLFVSMITNELGHLTNHTYEYGTGAALTTTGPNRPACALTIPISCPPNTPQFEEYRQRVDGLGRMIESFESFDTGTGSFRAFKIATANYADGPLPSVTYNEAIDHNESTFVVRYRESKRLLDGNNRLVEETVSSLSAGTVDAVTRYVYSNNGTLSQIDISDPTVDVSSNDTVSYTYTFDSLGRVTSARRPDAAAAIDRSGVDVEYDGLAQTDTTYVGAGLGERPSTRSTFDRYGRLTTGQQPNTLTLPTTFPNM